jgi:dihydropteroate synthase
VQLQLGDRRYDLTNRALLMGILNRTLESFHDGGAYFRLEALLRRAETLVADGADLLDVGAVRPASEPTRSVTPKRSAWSRPPLTRCARASTCQSPSIRGGRRAFEAGAVIGNDLSGYLPAAAAARRDNRGVRCRGLAGCADFAGPRRPRSA